MSDRDRYKVDVFPGLLGWFADVTLVPEGGIGLQGPTFWRPTRRWVVARAERLVFRRLRRVDQRESAETLTYPERAT